MRYVEYVGRNGPERHAIYEPGDDPPEHVASWRGASEGLWTLTDDGCVVQVLASGHLKDGTAWVRTCTGTFRCIKDERLHTEPRQNRYTFNGKSPNYSKVTPAVDQFARLAARGMPPTDAYQAAFPRSGRQHAEKRAKWLLRKTEVREIVAQELGELMDRLGIDEVFILNNFKDIAQDPDNANARVSALKELANMRGMVKKQKTEGILKFEGIPLNRLEGAARAVEEGNRELILPEGITNAISTLPTATDIDFSTVEASLEVTVEDGGFEEDA